MYVDAYVCMYVGLCVCTVSKYVHTYIAINTHEYVHTYVCRYVHTYVVFAHVRMYVLVHMYVWDI